MTTLHAIHSKATPDELLAPDGPAWRQVDGVRVDLEPTLLERQPSAYIQASWRDREWGLIRYVDVKSIFNESSIALKVSWQAHDAVRLIDDNNVYADACAALFPENGNVADIATMGSLEDPVIGWHWRAGTDEPFRIRATGIGTVERLKENTLQCRAHLDGLQWQVTFLHDRAGFGDTVPIGFAVWCGAGDERAGLKSHTPMFHHLIMGTAV